MIFALQTIAEPLPAPHFFAGKVPVSLRIWQTEVVSRKIPTGRSNESRCKVAIAERHRRCRFRLKMDRYGPCSFAFLTNANGDYVQVAGGRVTCMVERYIADDKRRFRAYHDKPNPVYPDGTILAFRGGNLTMKPDERFMSSKVIEIFVSFLEGQEFPSFVHWRDAPGF